MSRRSPKIPMASAGGDSEIIISDKDWLRIENEKMYGHRLSPDTKNRIIEATKKFVYWEVFERNAPPLSEAHDWIRSAQEAASEFRRVLLNMAPARKRRRARCAPAALSVNSSRRSGESDVSVYANHLVRKNFNDPRLVQGDRLRHLGGVLRSFVDACERALRDNESGYVEGESWNDWILSLTKILKAEQLPTKASNSYSKSGASSPFVLLVEELQNRLPKEARRHDHSKEALARAINRARGEYSKSRPSGINQGQQRDGVCSVSLSTAEARALEREIFLSAFSAPVQAFQVADGSKAPVSARAPRDAKASPRPLKMSRKRQA
jgi:hypothetical protein